MTITINDITTIGCHVGVSLPEGACVDVRNVTSIGATRALEVRSREEDRLNAMAAAMRDLSPTEQEQLASILGQATSEARVGIVLRDSSQGKKLLQALR